MTTTSFRRAWSSSGRPRGGRREVVDGKWLSGWRSLARGQESCLRREGVPKFLTAGRLLYSLPARDEGKTRVLSLPARHTPSHLRTARPVRHRPEARQGRA